MKLVSYNKDEQDQLAILADGVLYDTDLLHPDLPVSMNMFLNFWEDVFEITSAINKKLEEGKISRNLGIDYSTVQLLSPVPHATSFRNACGFIKHCMSADQRNDDEILNNYYSFPSFYFANHNCFQGPGDIICMPDHLKELDFEPGIAIVINKAGKNIKAVEADQYIGGYMIINNIISRSLYSAKSMPDSLSVAGRRFAAFIGPVMVTQDELEQKMVECEPKHTGNAYNLLIKCRVNDVQVSEMYLADMDWTFAEVIEQASYGVQLFPGDIIGCTINAGCFFEANIKGKSENLDFTELWLKEDDVVEVEIKGLGKLSNTIIRDESEFSLLKQL